MVSELGDRLKEGCQIGQSGLCMPKNASLGAQLAELVKQLKTAWPIWLLVADAALYISILQDVPNRLHVEWFYGLWLWAQKLNSGRDNCL